MGNTWHTDIEHFLDVDGYPALDLPRPAERLMEYFGSIIEAVTGRYEKKAMRTTGIRCRRRPGHRRCDGRIMAGMAAENPEAISWECPACSDGGFISGWRGSMWDRTADGRRPVE
ncbi:MAG: hypothetical protein ABSD38_29950 [Syntrophorhabdales bacterium]|jgi:hypothetical protein